MTLDALRGKILQGYPQERQREGERVVIGPNNDKIMKLK